MVGSSKTKSVCELVVTTQIVGLSLRRWFSPPER